MTTGWEDKMLGEVCLKITDGSHNPAKGTDESKYRMLSSKNVLDDRITLDNPRYLHEDEFKKENARTDVCPGDVLLTIVGTVGRTAVVPDKFPKVTFQRSVAVLKPNRDVINSRFLMFSLQNIVGHLLSNARGVAQKGIYLKTLRKVSISLPALSQQRLIVDKLDAAFEGIVTANANTEKNLHNVHELFESFLQSIFSMERNEWQTKPLSEVCVVERGSSPRPIKKYLTSEANGVNWIKIGDTKGVRKYLSKTKEKITPEGATKSRYVKEGDFILSNSMSFGQPYIMKTTGYIHDGWFVLRLSPELNVDYFYYLLISPTVQRQFAELATGAIVKNISSDITKKAVLPIPCLKEQKEIAAKIEALEVEVKRIEDIYQKKLTDISELRESILTKAFAGELHL